MIEFFDSAAERGTASIYESHITLNKVLAQYFTECYKVRVGIDKEAKKVFLFIFNKDMALSGEYKESSLLPISLSKSYARVCSRAMVEYVCSAFNLTLEKGDSKKFKATYDDSRKAVIIDFKEEEK